MIELPNVTLVIVDSVNYGDAVNAIQKSLQQIKPMETIFFTDIDFGFDYYHTEIIPHLYSKEDYSKFMIKKLGKYPFETSHVLVIQHDGFVLDGEQWTDEFLTTDYIGAAWHNEVDGLSVGNGGFRLRSTRLLKILAEDNMILGLNPEDAQISRLYRPYLEATYGIEFASVPLADKFSYELTAPSAPTFGFHGAFHPPYKQPIVIRRTGAMGDVVALSPVLQYWHEKGHPVFLDSPYHTLYQRHFFPVHHMSGLNPNAKARVFNLDLAYEVNPEQLHLKSYFEMCGITDYTLRNPKLNYHVEDFNRMFKRYCVLHIDIRDTPERNLNGVEWEDVKAFLEAEEITLIQIGRGISEDVGLRINTVNDPFLFWLLAGAEFVREFIGQRN